METIEKRFFVSMWYTDNKINESKVIKLFFNTRNKNDAVKLSRCVFENGEKFLECE